MTLYVQTVPHIERPNLQLLPAGGEESDGKGKGEGL